MKRFLTLLSLFILYSLTEGATYLARYPPGTQNCSSGTRSILPGEKYNPRAETESDPCFEETCDGNEIDGLSLDGVTCGRAFFEEDPSGKCRLVVEPGTYPDCCPTVKCKDSWD